MDDEYYTKDQELNLDRRFTNDPLEGLELPKGKESQKLEAFEATPKQLPKKENSAENQVDGNSPEQLGGTESQESEEVESISRPIIQHTTKKKFKNDNSALYPDTDRLVGTDFQISDELEQTSGEEDYAENQVDGKSDEPLGNTESQKLYNYPQCQS